MSAIAASYASASDELLGSYWPIKSIDDTWTATR